MLPTTERTPQTEQAPKGQRPKAPSSRAGMVFALVGLVLAPLVTLYATQVVWQQSLTAPLGWMANHLGAVALFWLLFSSLSWVIYGLVRHLFPACIVQVALSMGVAVVSRYKFDINGSPLQLSDFSLIGGLGDITEFALSQLVPPVLTVVGVVIAAILTETLRRKETWRIPRKPGLVLSCVGVVLCILCLVSAGPIQSAAIALTENCQDQKDRSDESGVVLGLYGAWSQRQWMEAAADNADAQAMAQLFQEDAVAPTEAATDTPDIIFITSESFFDVTRLTGLTFETDPLPNYHRLAETCTDGYFLSNTFGGGTGYVEMEMFTALTSSLLKEGDTLSTLDTSVYETLPTTVRLLKQAGYTTTAIHSYNDTLYNRSTVYPLIGFDEALFVDDFLVDVSLLGPYPSDDSFADEIIARYEARDASKPCFLYGLSMENHQSYNAAKYGELSDYPAQSDLLSSEDLVILDSLVYGLHDADAALGKLVDYFSQVDRPVMLVFVGDHLPSVNLADGTSLYTRLGYNNGDSSSAWTAETLAEMLSTNYLIWTNYETDAVPDHTESCTFLGLHTLQRAGLPLNDYFSWLAENLSQDCLLTRGRFFADAQGNASYEVPEEAAEALELYEQVEWNLAYGD